ncbi:MAG: HD domain-containing protein [Lachnospiraceae bacterium]|nr:HD domain-containing protein [Lachnospiraceae bacterium]MDE6626220.1 HD domain-containing protein [Lachnospiraceae bacterium]
MAYRTFAAIDVGSTDVTMKIFEVTAKKGYRQLDYVSNIMELGLDTYKDGYISQESVERLCDILIRFSKKMREYRTTDCCAYATSAIREAKNNMMVLDLLKLRTGIEVKILNNSEHRFLMYKGLAVKAENFEKIVEKNTAIVDIGAGSIQISLTNNGRLIATQNIPIGALRVRERLKSFRFDRMHLERVMEEFIANEINTFRHHYLRGKEIKNVIAIGDEIGNLIRIVPELEITDHLNEEQLNAIFDRLLAKSPAELASEYKIPYERATLLLPAAMIYGIFLRQAKADLIWTPSVDLCDGIIVDVLEKNKNISFKRNFEDDIRSSVYQVAKRYRCNEEHNHNVSAIACKIFDKTKKIHGLQSKERLQLEIAATLHDCGKFINMNRAGDNSYAIIMSTEIMGLSHKEREEIANVVRYNSVPYPDYREVQGIFGTTDYMKIAKLVAILKVANAMDRSHKQKASTYNIVVKDKQLVITIDTLYDLALERGLFDDKADFFLKVYGIRPVLKQRGGEYK